MTSLVWYNLVKKTGIKWYTAQACYSQVFSGSLENILMIRTWIATEHVSFTEKQVQRYARDLKSMGFRFDYNGIQEFDYPFIENTFSSGTWKEKESPSHVIAYEFVIFINYKKGINSDRRELLSLLTLLRYLWENFGIVKYYLDIRRKLPKLQKFKAIQLAVFFKLRETNNYYCTGHHILTAPLKTFLDKKEFWRRVKEKKYPLRIRTEANVVHDVWWTIRPEDKFNKPTDVDQEILKFENETKKSSNSKSTKLRELVA